MFNLPDADARSPVLPTILTDRGRIRFGHVFLRTLAMKYSLFLRATLVVVAAFGSTHMASVQATPTYQWSTGSGANGHYYMATESASTWTDADTQAKSLGGYLASVTSADEQAFINRTFLTGAAGNVSYAFWIGLTDSDSEGIFKWTSGEAFSYSNWGSGEPNNYTGGLSTSAGEDYVVLNWQYANGLSGAGIGQWNDTPNSGCNLGCLSTQTYRAIVEFDRAPTPVAATDTLSLALTTTPISVAVGDRLTYQAVITNTGNTALTGVHLAMSLPDSAAIILASDGCNLDRRLVNIIACDFATLAIGESKSPSITVKSGLPGQMSVSASVSSNEADPNTTNNATTVVTTVSNSPSLSTGDLAIRFGGPTRVKLNSKPTFSLTIKNNTANPVQQVVVSGQFPNNVKLNVKLPRFCTRNDQNLVRCGIGVLPGKTSKTFKLKAKANRAGVISTTATISSIAINDSNPSNNIAPIRVSVK